MSSKRAGTVTTPRSGLLFHFTHRLNLPSVIAYGLRSDSAVRADGSLAVEVGEDRIKEQRRRRGVPIGPGGVVADYVPFYFAARSPMLYAISRGNVPAYQDGQNPLVYLVTDLDRLQKVGCRFVFTDRNAYYQTATYAEDPAELDQLVDWELMEATMWNNTAAEPDRMERRMAELWCTNRCRSRRSWPWAYARRRSPAPSPRYSVRSTIRRRSSFGRTGITEGRSGDSRCTR